MSVKSTSKKLSKKKPDNKKPNNKKTDNKKLDTTQIVGDIVKTLKTEISKKIDNLRSDLHADFDEKLKRANVQTPNTTTEQQPANGFDMNKLMNSLQGKDGKGIDMTEISKMMGGFQQSKPMTNPDGSLIDMKTLTLGQIEYLKMERQDKMLGMLMPLLMGSMNQNQSNPMIAEMMQRLFMEKIGSTVYMDKLMMQFMMKIAGGGKLPPGFENMQNNLTSPVTDAISQTTTRNVIIP